jgi:Asp-tRNA(Asn)/Glu-tRNA(Gln) amidotransferase A subunit family amidase
MDAGITRRNFFAAAGAGAVAMPPVRALRISPRQQESQGELPLQERLGISEQTIAEAEKLAAVELTPDERAMLLRTVAEEAEGYRERRTFEPPNSLAPAMTFDPRLPGVAYDAGDGRLLRSNDDPGPAPSSGEEIAYAPVTKLSRWIERGDLTSERLTRIYLHRLKEHGPKLECVVTLTEDLAIGQAKRADEEIAAGRYRGPLHGIPWGAKDLLDTKGIPTTWGAEPYANQVPDADAAVVKLLEEAGAVLVAKLTLGAIAYGDIWHGGRTNNPWNLEQGSSGSSAGSAAATAAGLVGFSIGTETLGSIVSPSTRCGTTGLRPTFGRVPRTGAMALCWSLDKIGPICRTVEDCALVLHAINGIDPGDASSLHMPFSFDASRAVGGMRAGYVPRWFEGRGANDIDRRCLEAARTIGLDLVEVSLPDLPYGSLRTILTAEAAAAFEELTLKNLDDQLKWQSPQAWPNTFRAARFIPAIELIQAERFRRHVMRVMHDVFEQNRLDAMIGPSYAGNMLLITNNTGHPSLTIRAGFGENGTPTGFTIWGRLFGEGAMCSIGMAMEKELDVWDKRPPEFS